MTVWVYMLRCRDQSYYTGLTTALEQRIGQHRAGTMDGYTASRLPFECVYAVEFQNMQEAIAWERRIKRRSRAKKEALIARDYDRLPELSKNRRHHPSKSS